MAEALAVIGVIASVAQLADYGFKLSIKLFTFGEAVSRADKSIRSLSNEVSVTSAVLKELGEILKADNTHVVSERAIEATEQTVRECNGIFEKLDKLLEKCRGGFGSEKGKEADKMGRLERLRWPFFQPKMDLLRSNLDRLKASLTLMLQVLSYARDMSDRKQAAASLEYQKEIIESLARSEREAKKNYESLRKRLEGSGSVALDRELGDHQQQHSPPPYLISAVTLPTPSPNPTKDSDDSMPLVGELILCFNLVQNLLCHHLSLISNSIQHKNYVELHNAVDIAHHAEMAWLEETYGVGAFKIGAEAARNAVHLQSRLRQLAQTHRQFTVAAKTAETRRIKSILPLSRPKIAGGQIPSLNRTLLAGRATGGVARRKEDDDESKPGSEVIISPPLTINDAAAEAGVGRKGNENNEGRDHHVDQEKLVDISNSTETDASETRCLPPADRISLEGMVTYAGIQRSNSQSEAFAMDGVLRGESAEDVSGTAPTRWRARVSKPQLDLCVEKLPTRRGGTKAYSPAINNASSIRNESGYEVETDSIEDDDESGGGVLQSLLLQWTNLPLGTADEARWTEEIGGPNNSPPSFDAEINLIDFGDDLLPPHLR